MTIAYHPLISELIYSLFRQCLCVIVALVKEPVIQAWNFK